MMVLRRLYCRLFGHRMHGLYASAIASRDEIERLYDGPDDYLFLGPGKYERWPRVWQCVRCGYSESAYSEDDGTMAPTYLGISRSTEPGYWDLKGGGRCSGD